MIFLKISAPYIEFIQWLAQRVNNIMLKMICVFLLGLLPLRLQARDLKARQSGEYVVEVLHHYNVSGGFLTLIGHFLHCSQSHTHRLVLIFV